MPLWTVPAAMKVLLLLVAAAVAFAHDEARRHEKGARLLGGARGRRVQRTLKGSSGGGSKGGGPPDGECRSAVANAIARVEAATVLNPKRCCDFNGPTATIITHALFDDRTSTGFEPFWDMYYNLLDEYTETTGTCFVMTGFNQVAAAQYSKTLSGVMVQINALVALLPSVPAIMSTNPTNNLELTNVIRVISETTGGPSIGVFNIGFQKLAEESIVTGKDRLPYVGYTDEDGYGAEAANITLKLLKGAPAIPLCFNGRPDLPFVGRRCATYYDDITNGNPPSRYYGVTCRADSDVDSLAALMVENKANAVFSHIDCCQPVALAASQVEKAYNQSIVVGCQDGYGGAPPDLLNFVTTQPIELQAYQVTSWVNLPIAEATEGKNGRADEFFPSLLSLMNTAVYNIVMF